MPSKLSRHIKKCHKDNERVKKALKLDRKKRLDVFEAMKKEGIVEYNKREARKANPEYQGQRILRKYIDRLRCSVCNAFVSKRFFSYHKRYCLKKNDTSKVFGVPMCISDSDFPFKLSPKFLTEIVAKFRQDPVGNLCRVDKTILFVGSNLYKKLSIKVSKKSGVNKRVRHDMRTLSSLYLAFKSNELYQSTHGSSIDMFLPANFDIFTEAVEKVTNSEEEETMKSSLVRDIFYLVQKSVKKLRAYYSMRENDELASQLERFLIGFLDEQDSFLYAARYNMEKARLVTTRKPSLLPIEEDVKAVRDYTLQIMKDLLSVFELWTSHTFIELRNSTLTRLTLLNGRRGGEVGRLLLSEWKEAEENNWIDSQRYKQLSKGEKMLVDAMKITYMAGKGNRHVVSLLIPEDTVPALRKLTDMNVRKACGVSNNNKFVFASTQLSDYDASGWHAFKDVCSKLELKRPELMNATKNRHRVSTLYAALELPERDRKLFYDHMGHSEDVNRDVYQAPLALMGITRIGKQLLDFDKGEFAFIFTPTKVFKVIMLKI